MTTPTPAQKIPAVMYDLDADVDARIDCVAIRVLKLRRDSTERLALAARRESTQATTQEI